MAQAWVYKFVDVNANYIQYEDFEAQFLHCSVKVNTSQKYSK